jgi:hypothetical protein
LPPPSKLAQSETAPRGAARRDATFVPVRGGPGRALATKSVEETEQALLREFLRYKSVAALAQGVAARVSDGRTADELIAAADASVLRGAKTRSRSQRAP